MLGKWLPKLELELGTGFLVERVFVRDSEDKVGVCVTLDGYLPLSGPQFPYLQSEGVGICQEFPRPEMQVLASPSESWAHREVWEAGDRRTGEASAPDKGSRDFRKGSNPDVSNGPIACRPCSWGTFPQGCQSFPTFLYSPKLKQSW